MNSGYYALLSKTKVIYKMIRRKSVNNAKFVKKWLVIVEGMGCDEEAEKILFCS